MNFLRFPFGKYKGVEIPEIMKKEIKKFEYQNKSIVFTADGWINATQTCKDLGKENLDNFLRSKEYAEYASIVAENHSVKITELKITTKGGKNPSNGGTFLHPKMAETRQCGIYEISKKQMSFDTGYNVDTITKLIDFLQEKGKIFYSNETSEIGFLNFKCK